MKWALLLFVAFLSYGADVHLAWDANTEPDLVGYKLHYGFDQGGEWPYTRDVGNVTEYLFRDLPDEQQIYFVATAYNATEESAFSNEVVTVAYYFLTVKIDYAQNGRVNYRGEHPSYNASESDPNWTITKYYYSNNGLVVEMRRRITSWALRASGW